MSSVDESVTTLALLRSLLDEVGRRKPSRDSRSPPTLRLQILRRLLKEAANGNAGAFELLASLKRAMPASKGIPRSPAGEMRFAAGTLSQRMMKCGKPNCRCATDPSARHGPYFEWGRMRAGKIAHRYVTPEQAKALRHAIDNYRLVKKLLRAWEADSERLIDANYPTKP